MIAPGNYFITGTDTGIGKTHVACHWMRAMRTAGHRPVPMKPVAAGCTLTPAGRRNEDALQLLAASGLDLPYERVNRYAFEPAIAPHIAAAEAGVEIRLEQLAEDFAWLQSQGDCLAVEGAGGWRVPLGPTLTTADIPRALNLDVILVVGMRLGCLNHALLSAERILADGCHLAGWVANFCIGRMDRAEENLAALNHLIAAPQLWTLSFDK